MNPSKTIGSLIIASVFLVLAFGSTDENETRATSSMVSATPDYRMTASELYEEWEFSDEDEFEQKFRGTIISASGTAGTWSIDGRQASLILEDYIYPDDVAHPLGGEIECLFSAAEASQVANLKPGQKLTVKGRYRPTLGSQDLPILEDCILE